MQRDDTATVHIAVRNNTGNTKYHAAVCSIVCLSADRGASINPEGATQLPLTLEGASSSSELLLPVHQAEPWCYSTL